MDGLPPLPKSLSGLLNFSRESLSRAEGALGLRNPQAASPPVQPQPQAQPVPKPSLNPTPVQRQKPPPPPNLATR